jgi:hypothetical protein
MIDILVAWATEQAPILVSAFGASGVGGLAVVLVRHFLKVHMLHEVAKAAIALRAAGVSVQVQLGAAGETALRAESIPDQIPQTTQPNEVDAEAVAIRAASCR